MLKVVIHLPIPIFFNRTTDEDKMWTVIDQKNGLVCLIQKDF